MSNVYLVEILVGMFVITFGIRFVLLARAHKVVLPSGLERGLKYVPVAVLTAIITPMVFMPNKVLDISLDNPWLIGATVALIFGLWRQQQLLTISAGVVSFFIARYFI